MQSKASIPQPERGGRSARTEKEAESGAGVFGVRAQIPRAFGPPCGCCASLRSEIVIRPQKPDCSPFLEVIFGLKPKQNVRKQL